MSLQCTLLRSHESLARDMHAEEIIKALKALKTLPQCTKANTEATNMSAKTPSGVKKSRSKKERSKQERSKRIWEQEFQAVAHLVDGLQSRYTKLRTPILAATQVALAGAMQDSRTPPDVS